MIIQKKERDTVYLVNNIFEQITNEYTYHGQELLSNPKIIEAFANRDRKELQKLTLPIYEKLRKENPHLNIMHFHTVGTHSFLRLHKLEKYGDDLSGIREIIVKTNQFKKIQTGLETGKYGLSYRVTFPVFKDNKHIGAFEFGIDIKYLMSKVSTLNVYTPVLIVEKEAVAPIYKYDKTANKYLRPFSKEYFLVNYKSNREKNILIKELVDTRIINENSYIASKN
ncbi:MAG: hypothetical protein KAR81_06990, partial [Sulfurimonas sp.]|nr:hypothetical protein [Sulfurimonas sp.]